MSHSKPATAFGSSKRQREASPPSNATGNGNTIRAAFASPPFEALGVAPDGETKDAVVFIVKKTPLLLATPPTVTRALAHAWLPLQSISNLLGLVTWTRDDPWESVLLVALFWLVVLYGDIVLLYAGPLVISGMLLLVIYNFRYEPHEKQNVLDQKTLRNHSGASKQKGSFEDIMTTVEVLTFRYNLILSPLRQAALQVTHNGNRGTHTSINGYVFMSLRLLAFLPIWFALAMPPISLLSIRRIILLLGTTALTWHSMPARVTRTVLWRFRFIRQFIALITGLDVTTRAETSMDTKTSASQSLISAFRQGRSSNDDPNTLTQRKRTSLSPIRLKFVVFENQRRWLGIGWTNSLFGYERAPWTDEHLNPSKSKEEFELPHSPQENAVWRWVKDSQWKVDTGDCNTTHDADDAGWIYYDNKWNDGRRSQDGWSRYTRRRKWCRDAELIDDTSIVGDAISPSSKAPGSKSEVSSAQDGGSTQTVGLHENKEAPLATNVGRIKDASHKKETPSLSSRRGSNMSQQANSAGESFEIATSLKDEMDVDSGLTQRQEQDELWQVGDDVKMGLG